MPSSASLIVTMAAKNIRRLGLGLSKQSQERLRRQNLSSAEDMLSKSHLELIRIIGINYDLVNAMLVQASRVVAPRPITALDLWRRQTCGAYLATSLPALDCVLHGGLLAGTITEIAGPCGCGKTQMCIMLSLLATLPRQHGGHDGAVIYIDTEAAFSAHRLLEMAERRLPELFPSQDSLLDLASKVHVMLESTVAGLLQRLEKLEEDIITKGVKLVVLDSAASLVRKEYAANRGRSVADRANCLAKLAAILKNIAEAFSIPVVVTNQITTRYGDSPSARDENDPPSSGAQPVLPPGGSEGYVTAALGNTWSHSVNTRLIMQFVSPSLRQLLVAKSPVAPFSVFDCSIQADGVVLRDHFGGHYEGTDPGLQKIRVRSSLPQPWSNSY